MAMAAGARALLRGRGPGVSSPALQLLRHASSPAVQGSREDLTKKQPQSEVVYEGVMASTLRRVKLLSISSFAFSTLGAPVLAFHTYPDVSIVAKGGIASLMIILSATTTAALHWFAGTYVRKLTWTPGSREIMVETFDMLSRPFQQTIHLSEIKPVDTNRPLATFYAKGAHFYVDEDAFPSSELLKKLVKK